MTGRSRDGTAGTSATRSSSARASRRSPASEARIGARATTLAAVARLSSRSGFLAAPELGDEPLRPHLLEGFRPGLGRLPVVADLGVEDVEHLLPLIGDGDALAGAVDRGGAVALGRIVRLRADAAA